MRIVPKEQTAPSDAWTSRDDRVETTGIRSAGCDEPTTCSVRQTRYRSTALNDPIIPRTKGSQAMTTIHADQLRPGDLVVYAGRRHLITHVEHCAGWAW